MKGWECEEWPDPAGRRRLFRSDARNEAVPVHPVANTPFKCSRISSVFHLKSVIKQSIKMLKQNIICIHYTQKSTDIIQSFYQIPIL